MTGRADLRDPGVFMQGVPWDGFAWMRENEPVSWFDLGNGDGFWALTRYDDVVNAGRDWELYSSSHGTNIEDAHGGAELMMINMDPPAHTRLRALVQHGFTARVVRALEPHIKDLATRIVDNVARRGECDFVTDIAAELPLQVIAELIGIPGEDRHKIFEWSNEMIVGANPEAPESDIKQATDAAMQMWAYCESLADQRRTQPENDVMTILLNAEVDGHRLTAMDLNMFFMLLAVAGNETTRNLMVGGMLELSKAPEQREKLVADLDTLLPSAVEEMLRCVTPVMYFRRTPTRDVELHGTVIREGQKVTLWYISANRDEAMFERGHEFHVDRHPNLHQAFGAGGPHFCLGASLARIEIEAMYRELMTRIPDIAVSGPVTRLRSNFINATRSMPVRFTPERT